jgi:hypothetical protein
MSLNLTIEETLNNLNENITTLSTTLAEMELDTKVSELSALIPALQDKVSQIVKMYNDVSELQIQVNAVKN